MPDSVSDWFTSLVASFLLLLAVIGIPVALWWERRHPTSYTGQEEALGAAGVDSMAGWLALSAAEQEAVDTASLDRAEQAELDARADAREAAEAFVERAAVINALHHP
jgi:hypothetical protein